MVQTSKEQLETSMSSQSNSSKASKNWMNVILPFNMAVGPVGTFAQLYILELGGSVVDVSLAVALYNLVSIPSLMLWGFVTDRVYKRRLMTFNDNRKLSFNLAFPNFILCCKLNSFCGASLCVVSVVYVGFHNTFIIASICLVLLAILVHKLVDRTPT